MSSVTCLLAFYILLNIYFPSLLHVAKIHIGRLLSDSVYIVDIVTMELQDPCLQIFPQLTHSIVQCGLTISTHFFHFKQA